MEHAHSFGELGSPAKKSHLKGKAFIAFDLNFVFWGGGSPPVPLCQNVLTFVPTC